MLLKARTLLVVPDPYVESEKGAQRLAERVCDEVGPHCRCPLSMLSSETIPVPCWQDEYPVCFEPLRLE